MAEEKLVSTIGPNGPKSIDYVRACVQLPEVQDCPQLHLIIGPCRTGTTALYVAMAQQLKMYYQPLKSILRTGLGSLEIAKFPVQIGMKETLGPFHSSECTYNPVKILLEAGYPRQKLKVVLLTREPASIR